VPPVGSRAPAFTALSTTMRYAVDMRSNISGYSLPADTGTQQRCQSTSDTG
jgi:hypothetical protein